MSPKEKRRISTIFRILKQDNPEPRGDLVFKNPFELLVAVVLSAQATDVSVNKATPALFEQAPDPQAMVDLGIDGIREHIRSIGLFNNKAKNIHALSQELLDRFAGEVPQNRPDLESLPGVGRKSANVVLNVAFGQPTLAVDTHVFRVAHRLGFATGKTPTAVEKQLLQVVPKTYMDHAHHWMILHGRYICKARKPECAACLIERYCTFTEKKTS
ncbi:MAG: endonuclease III [Magnetococcales bacterium]|nr:endonuclease III [Magnetococcales bacterium]